MQHRVLHDPSVFGDVLEADALAGVALQHLRDQRAALGGHVRREWLHSPRPHVLQRVAQAVGMIWILRGQSAGG